MLIWFHCLVERGSKCTFSCSDHPFILNEASTIRKSVDSRSGTISSSLLIMYIFSSKGRLQRNCRFRRTHSRGMVSILKLAGTRSVLQQVYLFMLQNERFGRIGACEFGLETVFSSLFSGFSPFVR